MTDLNAHIPLGTVRDLLTESPRTVTRDYDALVFPEMAISLEDIALLRKILDDGEAEILAFKAREAGEADDAPESPSPPSCPDCGGMVCAVCASLYGAPRVHVYSGRCANGHGVPEEVGR